MINWLLQTIDIPIWALLTLAGYQRVFKLGKRYRQRKQKQNGRNRNNSGTSGSEDIATDSKSD